MHKSTSLRRRRFGLFALLGTSGAALVPAAALIAGVSPAQAASFASQPDTQVAVFMVPLTLLVLALIFEVARYVWRGSPPAQPPRPPRPTHWTSAGQAG